MVSLYLLKSSISTNSFLTLVFVSLFLISLGTISHDVFADTTTGVTINKDPNPELPTLTILDLYPHIIPLGLAYDHSSGDVYVANSAGDHSISVIDGKTFTIIANITLANGTGFSGPMGLAFDPENHYVYATDAPPGMVSIVDAKTQKIVDTINLHISDFLSWAVINLHSHEVYVNDPVTDLIYVISTKTNKVIDSIHASTPFGIAYNQDDRNLYVTNEANTVQVISGKTHEILYNINTGCEVSRFIAFDSHGKHAYVTCDHNGISVIDTKSRQVVQVITLPTLPNSYTPEPYDLAFDSDNGYMYVINYEAGFLSVIDTNSMTLVGYIHTPPSSFGILYNQKNNLIYLSNEDRNSVTLIRPG